MSVLRSARARAAAAAAALLALLAPTAAHAIVNGQPTSDHGNVGSFVVEVPDGSGGTDLLQLCTGTLVAPRVVLTASHCMERSEFPTEWGEVFFTLEQRIGDGTSWTLLDGLDLMTGTLTPDPRYAGAPHYRYDVGAFVLDEDADLPIEQLATLAALGFLDDKSLRGTTFSVVGYGIERYDRTRSTQSFLPPKERMLASQPLTAVNRQYAYFSMSIARGHGGTCYGDSGGPHLNVRGEIVAITTTGDIPCKASDQSTRTDTAVAHTFINGLIADPDRYK